MDKEEFKQMLKQFSKQEILELFDEDSEPVPETTHTIDKKRSRGKGGRKKNRGNNNQVGAKRRSRPQALAGPKTNKFDDIFTNVKSNLDEREKEELAAAAKEDAKNKKPRTPRTRSDSRMSVKCRSCGKEELISPVMLYDPKRYKCNECAGQAV